MPSRMIFFSVAFKFGASADRSLTKVLLAESPSSSASCSNRRSWDEMFGPVTISAALILECSSAGAAAANDATASKVLRFDSFRTFYTTQAGQHGCDLATSHSD